MYQMLSSVLEGNADTQSGMLSLTLPTNTQITYSTPSLPVLLSLSAYLYLLSATSVLADFATHAPLLGPLITGILLGPSLAGLLTPSTQQFLISLGYIGLILIVFEAGLTTHISLLFRNIGVSTAAALTGVLVPIGLSIALLHGAYGYTMLQAFAAGAALCSTSLGTTIALLTPRLRKTRVGSVLMCAALLDDVVGLVIAGIIGNLADAEDRGVRWETVVRPILVSIAFGVGTPGLAWVVRRMIRSNWGWLRHFCCLFCRYKKNNNIQHTWIRASLIYDTRIQLFLIVLMLSVFVAGSFYAGTSELFGAYLAGTFLTYVFSDPPPPLAVTEDQYSQSSEAANNVIFSNSSVDASANPNRHINLGATAPATSTTSPTPTTTFATQPALLQSSPFLTPNNAIPPPDPEPEPPNPPLESFTTQILPILTPLLGPIFFASVGAALPVGTLFTTTTTRSAGEQVVKSHRVVWRGLIYALVMACAKGVVGVWMIWWRDGNRDGRKGAGTRLPWRTKEKVMDDLDLNSGVDAVNVAGNRNSRSETTKTAKTMAEMMPIGPSTSDPSSTGRISGAEGTVSSGLGRIYGPGLVLKPSRTRAHTQRHGELDLERGDDDIHAFGSPTRTGSAGPGSPLGPGPTHSIPLTSPSPTPDAPKPDTNTDFNIHTPKPKPKVRSTSNANSDEPTPTRAALLLGLAMIARGEIALIVAQLARPLLVRQDEADEEPFAVVIWAIVVCTVGGAVGVGMLLGMWRREEGKDFGG